MRRLRPGDSSSSDSSSSDNETQGNSSRNSSNRASKRRCPRMHKTSRRSSNSLASRDEGSHSSRSIRPSPRLSVEVMVVAVALLSQQLPL